MDRSGLPYMVEVIHGDKPATVAWFGRSGSARAHCRMTLEADVGRWMLEAIRVTYNGGALASWTPSEGWLRLAAEREEEPSPLDLLEREPVALWPAGKLGRYCNAIPKMLLMAFSDEQLSTLLPLLPRDKGPYTMEDLEAVSADGLCAEVGASLDAWARLLAWAQRSLYPEYQQRRGKAHGSAVYAEWLAWAPEVQAALGQRFDTTNH